MLDLVRTSLHRVLTTARGDDLLALRLPKDIARRVNVALGQPICSAEEPCSLSSEAQAICSSGLAAAPVLAAPKQSHRSAAQR